MSARPGFYAQAVVLTPERHEGWSVDPGAGFAFSRHTLAVPLVAAEFSRAVACYPIVFVDAEEGRLPVALLGLAERENLFIAEDGRWDAAYVPAFVRRYPFVFASEPGGERFTLCIDEAFVGCNTEGVGERLFSEGRPSPYLERMLAFLSEYQRSHQATVALVESLQHAGVFVPMRAERAGAGAERPLGSFLVVDRERLLAVPDARLAALARQGVLECVALHHASLHRFEDLAARRDAAARENL